MKFLVCFFFALFFGFFDLFLFFLLFSFSLVFFLFSYAEFCFMGFFFCDGVSFVLIFLSLFILLFIVCCSVVEKFNEFFHFHFLFCLFSIFFMIVICFLCFSMIFFYILFEFVFLLMFLFILFWGVTHERLQSSFYMFFYTLVVSFPFLVYIIYFMEHEFSLMFCFFYGSCSYFWLFVFLVFLIKLPLYSVHAWLPKAHVEAPLAGSMLLAGVLLKLGGYGFIRFLPFFDLPFFFCSGILVSFSLLGSIYSGFICLRQSDLKSFVAYSSVCHMGFGLSGLVSFSFYGYMGFMMMLISHGFCSSCLFYILYIYYERFHSRSVLLIKGVSGFAPVLGFFLFIFCVLNMGMPPSFSFFSEVFISVSVIGMNFFSFVFCGIVFFLAGLYSIYLYISFFHGVSFFEGVVLNISIRDFLGVFSHMFPLFFIPFFFSFFF